jgi:hypothetical protein
LASKTKRGEERGGRNFGSYQVRMLDSSKQNKKKKKYYFFLLILLFLFLNGNGLGDLCLFRLTRFSFFKNKQIKEENSATVKPIENERIGDQKIQSGRCCS